MSNTRQFLAENKREITEKARKFCAYRERCSTEVLQKLGTLGADKDLAEQILGSLMADGYIEDKRFASVFARSKFNQNHWGKIRIRLELQNRKIKPQDIQSALTDIEEDKYLQTLLSLTEKKIYELKGKENIKEKTAAYLMQKGFESELVWKTIKELAS